MSVSKGTKEFAKNAGVVFAVFAVIMCGFAIVSLFFPLNRLDATIRDHYFTKRGHAFRSSNITGYKIYEKIPPEGGFVLIVSRVDTADCVLCGIRNEYQNTITAVPCSDSLIKSIVYSKSQTTITHTYGYFYLLF